MSNLSALDDLDADFLANSLFTKALTHSSASPAHNERLEFLGDAVLGLCVAEYLYAERSDAPEGELSRMRAHLVNRATLIALADELQLSDKIIVGPGEGVGSAIRDSVLANAVEAILGAIYLVKGLDSCRQFIMNIYQSRFQTLPSAETLKDPKSKLQESLQKQGLPVPDYELIEESGKAHDRRFRIACRVAALSIETTAFARSRKAAEQAAAAEALLRLSHD